MRGAVLQVIEASYFAVYGDIALRSRILVILAGGTNR